MTTRPDCLLLKFVSKIESRRAIFVTPFSKSKIASSGTPVRDSVKLLFTRAPPAICFRSFFPNRLERDPGGESVRRHCATHFCYSNQRLAILTSFPLVPLCHTSGKRLP